MDPTRTLEIFVSPLRTLGYAALGLGMTAACLSLFFIAPADEEVVAAAIGGLGVLFFGLCTFMWLWQCFTMGAVVTLSPEGLRDLRVAREFIPWAAIERISTCTVQSQRFLIVALPPEIEQRLTLTRVARWTRAANRRLVADGLFVSAHGLKVDFAALRALVHAYAVAHGASAAVDGVEAA
ncbi:STM3941 family protein [Nannocystis bainbridge]|uniref:PH domain-containing protein n=1 Tax=Nannocystis bainbridge TaxID=2995303 RepID=A0ABT5DSV8_9BACT|nr:STM3941 family protein [Nannocystis bainbridge]MDC0716727.1 hypothetical protein [Nannocystis bainbridge]